MLQYIKTLSKSTLPCVIALRELYHRAQLPGYLACGSLCECTGKGIKLFSLVKRGMAFIDHSLDISEKLDVDHSLIEVVPCIGNRNTSIFVLNLDFNAPHTQWGYGADSPKEKRLAALVDELGLLLLNEPASHSRIGQGASRHVP
ncbi:hypothetical protein MRX96_004571 [Rhipicephalus microplus]